MFNEIPTQRPTTELLDGITSPADLRALPQEQLTQLCEELRHYLLYSVGQSGGHFGAGLGVVELTVALHYVFDTPNDKLVWDVGHQAYPHKILTGRREQLLSIRKKQGLAPFPRREESAYDAFGVGHSSTSISAALGMAVAAQLQQRPDKHVAIVGDGAMTAGMAFEALNHAGHLGTDMLVILNDNDMSISNNVGALSNYFARILSSRTYASMREGSKKVLSNIPHAWEFARKTEEHVKGMVAPGTLFEELGFNYIGPVNGHDLDLMVKTLRNMAQLSGPQFLHVVTQKGKGFSPAEQDPIKYHALAEYHAEAEKVPPVVTTKVTGVEHPNQVKKRKYSAVFGQWLCDMAAQDERLLGITPAMREGSDMVQFSEQYPQRYFDVGIAEQHAVTLAAGFACEGLKPVVAIYSTFLQRAYDQLIHDVCVQDLDVLFAIDRAGLVGADGPTHHGSFDLSYLRTIPNLLIMAPADENEARQMLYTGYQHPGPAAVRYPRGTGPGADMPEAMQRLPIGKARNLRQGHQIGILSFGNMLTSAEQVAEELNASLVDMRFIKPLDEARILQMAEQHQLLVTLEENALMGGAGSAVNEVLMAHNAQVSVLNLGLPDQFAEHASQSQLLADFALDKDGILRSIRHKLANLHHQKPDSAAVAGQ